MLYSIYNTVQYYSVQIRRIKYIFIQCRTSQNSKIQYRQIQHSTVQYSTEQYSTVQYITVQYSTNECKDYFSQLKVKTFGNTHDKSTQSWLPQVTTVSGRNIASKIGRHGRLVLVSK